MFGSSRSRPHPVLATYFYLMRPNVDVNTAVDAGASVSFGGTRRRLSLSVGCKTAGIVSPRHRLQAIVLRGHQ